MSDLAQAIRAEIELNGPIGVDRFMARALAEPGLGYYARRQPIGRDGDFITAPEISQMFGELIAAWLADLWTRAGRPAPLTILELGPGRGALMADLLRAAERAAGFGSALRPMLLEISPVLRAAQRRALAGREVEWIESISAAPEEPLLIVANEFFDALPVAQYVRVQDAWRERRVGIGPGRGLRFVRGPAGDLPSSGLAAALTDAGDGAVAEWCEAGEALAAEIGRRIDRFGGAALVVDYGYEERELRAAGGGDTLQAVRRHRRADIFERPGETDLTAHVNFTALGRAAAEAGARAWPVLTQGAFLESIGLGARAAALARGRPAAARARIAADRARLAGPDGMGRIFRALALTGGGWPAPAAFGAATEES